MTLSAISRRFAASRFQTTTVASKALISDALREIAPGHFKACIRDDLTLRPAL